MKKLKGFTLVELSIATAFLAVLLLMIATITISTAAIFQKGISLRNINATGRNLVDDFDRSITSAPLVKIKRDDKGDINRDLYFRERTGNVTIKRGQQGDLREVQLSGVFCSGKYSYVWNTGYALDSDRRYDPQKPPLQFQSSDMTEPMSNFYLLKFPDSNREACTQNIEEQGLLKLDNLSLAGTPPEEMLTRTENKMQLALYEFTIFPVVQDIASWRSFYTGTFILATLAGDVDVKSAGDHCNPENSRSLSSDFSYCAVNKFNFSAQASGQAE